MKSERTQNERRGWRRCKASKAEEEIVVTRGMTAEVQMVEEVEDGRLMSDVVGEELMIAIVVIEVVMVAAAAEGTVKILVAMIVVALTAMQGLITVAQMAAVVAVDMAHEMVAHAKVDLHLAELPPLQFHFPDLLLCWVAEESCHRGQAAAGAMML